MTHAVDTLGITRKLESAGVDRRQAEAHAEALNEVVVTRYSELATKTDLERFPSRDELRDELERFAGRFATKEDLERFATKDELRDELERFAGRFATKEDLERFATKEYLKEYLHEELKKYATKEDLEVGLAQLETRMFRLWAVSTVTLATLIISMPFVAG